MTLFPGRVVDLYRAVLIEAASPQDLYAYLDAGMLRRLWALMWLAQLRRAWELNSRSLLDQPGYRYRVGGGDGTAA